MSYTYNKDQQARNIARVYKENNKIGEEFIKLINEKGFDGSVKILKKLYMLSAGQDYDCGD